MSTIGEALPTSVPNINIASDRYGVVEIGPLTICHAILDFIRGLVTMAKHPGDQAVAAVLISIQP